MKVRTLINELQNFDPEMRVVVGDDEDGAPYASAVNRIEKVAVKVGDGGRVLCFDDDPMVEMFPWEWPEQALAIKSVNEAEATKEG